jgi:outer membrane protein OmpA-like peptidoglycan-associated protein
LYFASNGITGFGGYDIFFSEKDSLNNWATPVNIGTPINNHEDQFSLFITADGKKGYYSHEETAPSGYSTSKLFEMEIPEENQVKYRSNYVKGVIRDKQTKQPLSATVELINIDKNETESLVKSDSVSGEYLIVLTQGAEYALYVNKRGYLFNSENFNYSTVENFEPVIQDVELEKLKIGSTAVLNNIFFDVDKYELKEKSKTELLQIVSFLNENTKTNIEIGGHTDDTGSALYNKQLSEKRAYAVYAYLIQNGIESKRLLAKGYGPDKPVVPNDSEKNRQLNRRIEFKIQQ